MEKLSKCIIALIKAMGMMAENKEREMNNEALAYSEEHFNDLTKDLDLAKED